MRWILAFVILGSAFVASPRRVDANVHFCNATPAPVSYAVAMRWTNPAGAQYQAVQGWFTLEGGSCDTPLPFDPSMESLAFYYAPESQDGSWKRDADSRFYCVNALDNFTYWNSFEETPCVAPAQKRTFRHVQTQRNDMTVVFLASDVSLSL
ncbi:MAG: DUF1036 domain-containing protein [Candidatus Eremiobacteraeota bacterium]|nr:DUF1036 domain-containing protein [Candidatus Eremiobacteraeota bacterium]